MIQPSDPKNEYVRKIKDCGNGKYDGWCAKKYVKYI